MSYIVTTVVAVVVVFATILCLPSPSLTAPVLQQQQDAADVSFVGNNYSKNLNRAAIAKGSPRIKNVNDDANERYNDDYDEDDDDVYRSGDDSARVNDKHLRLENERIRRSILFDSSIVSPMRSIAKLYQDNSMTYAALLGTYEDTVNSGAKPGFNARLGLYVRMNSNIVANNNAIQLGNETFQVTRTIVSSNGGKTWNVEPTNHEQFKATRAEVYKMGDKFSYWVVKFLDHAYYMSVNLVESNKFVKLWKVQWHNDQSKYIEVLATIVTDDRDCPVISECLDKQYDINLAKGDRNFDLESIVSKNVT